jgi:hypothetical protein
MKSSTVLFTIMLVGLAVLFVKGEPWQRQWVAVAAGAVAVVIVFVAIMTVTA